MNPMNKQKSLMIGMGVAIAALIVVVIVLAVRKNPEAPAPTANQVTNQDQETPAPKPAPKRTPAAQTPATNTPNPEPVFDPASGSADFDAFAVKVTRQSNGTYTADFDMIAWQYNANTLSSSVVNPDGKTKTYELDKSMQLSYIEGGNYSEKLDRREVFFDIVNNQREGRESNLFHVVIKNDKVVSLVEIYRP